ncbi:hypothetical protein F5Y13DRAFT_198847 [Hypoxylon sp. FL1857]|nr:hypothetical protein F5Y13DRAFT_198847 [Hypoxylon sp. FL1857]
MNRSQISLLQREVYGDPQEPTFKAPRRAFSLPPLKKQSATPGEEDVPEKPHRSISLKSAVKRLPLIIPERVRDVQLGEGISDEDYDSDEEDRRNGVPITVGENRGGALTSEMKADVLQKIVEKQQKLCQLQCQLIIPRHRYLLARECLFESLGLNWHTHIWSYFNALEDEYYEKRAEVDKLECEISHLETILASFTGVHLSRSSWDIKDDGNRILPSSNADKWE